MQINANINLREELGWLVGWFYGKPTLVGYLKPNPFLYQ